MWWGREEAAINGERDSNAGQWSSLVHWIKPDGRRGEADFGTSGVLLNFRKSGNFLKDKSETGTFFLSVTRFSHWIVVMLQHCFKESA